MLNGFTSISSRLGSESAHVSSALTGAGTGRPCCLGRGRHAGAIRRHRSQGAAVGAVARSAAWYEMQEKNTVPQKNQEKCKT